MDLRQLWRIAPKTNRGSMMAGNVAIRCPVCGAKLGVLQGRAQLSGLLGFGMLILLALIASQLRTPGDSRLRTALIAAPFVIIAIAGYIIQQRSIPRLLQVRPLEEGEKVVYPLTPPAEEWETEEASGSGSDGDPKLQEENKPAWTCRKCGEKNPGNFEECWKCQTWRAEENDAK
jgi:hypothetical protein